MTSGKEDQKITILPMRKKDISAVAAIIASHDNFDGKCSEYYYKEYFTSTKRVKSQLEQNFVAVDKNTGAVVGVCGFAPDKYMTPGISWLTWFYLKKNYRGKGIGGRLLIYTINIIRKLKIKKIYLDTSSHLKYARSIKVYKKCGFNIEGTFVDYYGKGESMIIMSLDMKKKS